MSRSQSDGPDDWAFHQAILLSGGIKESLRSAFQENGIRSPGILEFAVFLTLFVSLAATVQAGFPGRNGLILFDCDTLGGNFSTVRRLCIYNTETQTLQTMEGIRDADVSADGTQIAFILDGTGVARDGDHLAIASFLGGEIAGINDLGVPANSPSWSPDGNKIVYRFLADIRIYDVASRTSTPIYRGVPMEAVRKPVWSPDGTRIAFRKKGLPRLYDGANGHQRENAWDLAIIDPLGQNFEQFTDFDALEYASQFEPDGILHLDWSPDGKSIVFDLFLHDSLEVTQWEARTRLYTILLAPKPEDSKLQLLAAARAPYGSPTGVDYFGPSWSPDGKKVVAAKRVAATSSTTAQHTSLWEWDLSSRANRELPGSGFTSYADSSDFSFSVCWAGAPGNPPIFVNSVADLNDQSPGNGNCYTGADITRNDNKEPECTLRAALQEAKAAPGSDLIYFDIPAEQIEGTIPIIEVQSALPVIDSSMTIDGTTQPTAGRVEIFGQRTVNGHGLDVKARVELRGLAILGFRRSGVHFGTGANSSRIRDAQIAFNEAAGIWIQNASNIQIGGSSAGDEVEIIRNGIGALVENSSGSAIEGNRFDQNRLPLLEDEPATSGAAILVRNSTGVRIGGLAGPPGQPPGNRIQGPVILEGETATSLIQGNSLTNGDLNLEQGNAVIVRGNSTGNTIGGSDPNERNEIYAAGGAIPTDPMLDPCTNQNRAAGVLIDSTDNIIEGNFLGTRDGSSARPNHVGIRILRGGNRVLDNLISGNRCSGILIQSADPGTPTHIEGNRIGTDQFGLSPLPNGGSGIQVRAGSVRVGGDRTGACEAPCNLISGNDNAGIEFLDQGPMDHGNAIRGNFIGVDSDGTRSLPNGASGIVAGPNAPLLIGGPSNAVLGACDGPCNVISGNLGHGIQAATLGSRLAVLVSGDTYTGLVIQGNFIGLRFDALDLGNQRNGIILGGNAHDNLIGGEVKAGNIIAFNQQTGVLISSGSSGSLPPILRYGSGNQILGNRIYSNGELGIDLNPLSRSTGDGPTMNDAGDIDSNGPNGLQNYPEDLRAIRRPGNQTTIVGNLKTRPGTYTVQFFALSSCDTSTPHLSSRFGEADVFLSSQTVSVPSPGMQAFASTVPLPVASLGFVATTATSPGGSTSELSECVAIRADSDGDLVADVDDPEPSNPAVASLPDGTRLAARKGSLEMGAVYQDPGQLGNPASPSSLRQTGSSTTLQGAAEELPEADFPIGIFTFTLKGLQNGSSTAIDLFLPAGVLVDTYFKFGPTPGNPQPHWYEFLYDGQTGAEFLSDRIVLHLRDGGRGDDDLSANGRVSEPGGPALLLPHALNFAQFGDGQGLFSQLLLVNPDSAQPARLKVRLRDDQGDPLVVDLDGEDLVGTGTQTVSPLSLGSLPTDSRGDVVAGSAQVFSNVPVGGVLLFGGSFGLAGVPSSEVLMEGFLTPVEVGSSVNTGVAVMNLEAEESMLQFQLLDTSGALRATAGETLPGNGHLSRFVTDLSWSNPPNFSNFRGLLQTTSNKGIAATVLQTRPGEFATLPVAPLRNGFAASLGPAIPGGSGQEFYFAHFGEGQGLLFSQILLMNLDSDTSANVAISLADDNGAPLSVDLNGQVVNGLLNAVLPAGGLGIFTTDGMGELVSGSSTITADRPLSGVVLFGGVVGVAGVGASQPLANGFLAPIEISESALVDTGIALMNLESAPALVTLELLDEMGSLLATAQRQLPAGGHGSFLVTDVALQWNPVPDLRQFQGIVRVTSNRQIAATLLQTRPGQFATIPVLARGM